ncbi:hypothetical protein C8246_14215 [Paracidovorax avenae]|nr:hypothetical protein C8246_14215 [Paracidovorax avenae]
MRVSTPSFSKMCSRCLFTVRGLMPRMSAMSRLVLPLAIQDSTSVSRGVRSTRGRRAAGSAPAACTDSSSMVSPRPLAPSGRASRRWPGSSAVAPSPACCAWASQRAMAGAGAASAAKAASSQRVAWGERQAMRSWPSSTTTPMPATSTASRASRAARALATCVASRASTSGRRRGLTT